MGFVVKVNMKPLIYQNLNRFLIIEFCKFGQGSRIYIKKINNKWVIDKIEGTWVS